VARFLKALKDKHRHQMTEVETIRRWIEATVERDRFLNQQLIECLGIGDLGYQATILQILNKGGLEHWALSTRQARGAPKL
jgi:hypothetical protein